MDDTPTEKPPRRRMTLAIIALVVLSPLVLMAVYVDDWSRDLTTNTAATAPDHADQRLRPVELDATPENVVERLASFCDARPAWRLAEENPLPADSPVLALVEGSPAATHHLIRTTGLMRYVDDIWVVVEDLGDGRVRLHADSRSRVGKGDLGQNPRNLRELLAATRESAAGR